MRGAETLMISMVNVNYVYHRLSVRAWDFISAICPIGWVPPLTRP